MNQRRLLALLLVLPTLAVAMVGLVWFVGRTAGPHWTGKLWSATTEPGHVLVRAQVASFPDRRTPERRVDVQLSIALPSGEVRRLSGQSGVDGFVDFETRLAEKPRANRVSLGLHVEDEAVIDLRFGGLREVSPPMRAGFGPTIVHLKPNGPTVNVELRHGVLTVPVTDDLRVSWADAPAAEPAATQLTLELEGAEGSAGQQTFRVASGDWLSITPTAHIVEVTLRTPDAEREVSAGVALLPVVPGAIAARLTSDGVVQVTSPVPRAEAHVAIASNDRVYSLHRVALTPATSGSAAAPRFQGEIALPDVVRRIGDQETLWAVTSSEPDFGSEAQVGWPLGPLSAGRTARFGWGSVYDGFDEQERRAGAWRHHLRWYAWLGLLGTSLAELLVLYVLVRRAAPAEGLDASPTTRVWPWIAVCCVAFGFAGLGSLFGFW